MKYHELEHIIRTIGVITQNNEFVIIGSQAILAKYPNAPTQLIVSQEADTYPLKAPKNADLIDELSSFHDQFDYYARYWSRNSLSGKKLLESNKRNL